MSAGGRAGGRDSNLVRVPTLRLRAQQRQRRQSTTAPGLSRRRTGCCITKGCRNRILAILMGFYAVIYKYLYLTMQHGDDST
eukprot:4674508-Pleurochrysis_carterae.AAC.1